ncbi:unnamed protein product [Prorocentrum cordatum]|uniref:Uncharacterized protein n=1 Tax=Prorocentrum cordatum TaxID=2364126 RepID=A0ABN9XUY5_9DINO|nr:unnamed protein product [Polarella glacialis]
MAHAAKRAAVAEPDRPPEAKRARELPVRQDVLDQLPHPPAAAGELPSWFDRLARALREIPFGQSPGAREWGMKRRAYALLEPALAAFIEEAEAGGEGRPPPGQELVWAAARAVSQLVRSGYAATARDRRALVVSGAWRPAAMACSGGPEPGEARPASELAGAVNVYRVHLAEHASFYEDFTGFHAEFWSPERFLPVLEALPRVVADRGDVLEADEWEAFCPELAAALKTLDRFLGFWVGLSGAEPFDFDVSRAMPLLRTCTEVFGRHDQWHGQEVSAKVRGDFLEQEVRMAGVTCSLILGVFYRDHISRRTRAEAVAHAKLLLRFMVQVLMLRVPTFGPRAEARAGPGSGALPLDERQLDTDWVEGLWEHCQSDADAGDLVEPAVLSALFQSMVDMPVEEQKYRLECVAPLVPPFISLYADLLKEKEIPPELADLKVVMNAVLQDDAFVNSDFMEEISFYPCLLEFATKRAAIHAVCERVKLHMHGDPIRLVVPRDNVLDGVCSSLNLQDQSARIDVPVEIEFRTGLVDSAGQELMDEGEDQGGLRRQWLDRGSRHFLSSDLFRSPSSSREPPTRTLGALQIASSGARSSCPRRSPCAGACRTTGRNSSSSSAASSASRSCIRTQSPCTSATTS